MRTFVAIALVGLVSVVRSDLPHYNLEKSFDTGLRECAELNEISNCDLKQYIADSFPNVPIVRKLLRCSMLNVKSYNDATGVWQPQMSAFFQPSPADSCYQNRTQVCLNSIPERVDPSDVDSLAYESFQCYYRSYGDLVESDQFLRDSPLEFGQVLVATSDYLQLSGETLVDLCKGNILNNDQFPKILYVIAVRAGFYSVNSGVQLNRLYIQFGNEALLTPETQQCVDDVAQENCSADDVTQNYQIFVKCLEPLLPIPKLLQEFSKQRVSDPDVCDCSSPQVQVYNVA
ncbi:uncharacterized protein LOC135701128 [Ochlerotatus camptorhynchus]|uniref:uncharacterized protein LOC135701128 n=1 Tax=Ochlerotatus camptorhynchus TaxID=644619 RepID=UPI0031DEF49F